MPEDLVVDQEFQPTTLQQVRTQPESATPSPASALSLAANAARIAGHDDVNRPLTVISVDTEEPPQRSWGRVVRLQRDIGGKTFFFDIGIDSNGSLYINSPHSTATSHVLTIDQNGAVAISALKNLDVPPPGVTTTDVVVDPRTGKLYRQN